MRYALAFLLAAFCLTVGAVATFARLSSVTLASPALPNALPVADTMPSAEVTTPAAPTAADYARFAEADRVWRERYARQYSIAELRARGNGRRTSREAMQDHVFKLTRRGDRDGAIRELESWVGGHPRDRESLLALARLLNEVGRTSDAVVRYREILALQHVN
jgi:Bacterial transcriptional activator domain